MQAAKLAGKLAGNRPRGGARFGGALFGGAAAKRGMSIVEVTIAMVVLAIAILGSTKALESSATLQSVTKERQAATLAASAQINDLIMLATVDQDGWDGIDTWNQTGFPVTLRAGVVGASADFSAATTTTAGSLRPAPANVALWPTTRSSVSAAVQSQAGYIEVVDVAGRTGLKRVTVTVAWTSQTGGAEAVRLTQLVVNPEL